MNCPEWMPEPVRGIDDRQSRARCRRSYGHHGMHRAWNYGIRHWDTGDTQSRVKADKEAGVLTGTRVEARRNGNPEV